uniref:G-protein coupled receptors family 1 profile domain-containing protein n=1 Tax=Ditylenchus dipsaci TaxID=166011 RepID=A0A915DS68_9BILA
MLLKNFLVLMSTAFFALLAINRHMTIANASQCCLLDLQLPYLFVTEGSYVTTDSSVVACFSSRTWKSKAFQIAGLVLFLGMLTVPVVFYYKLYSSLTKKSIPLNDQTIFSANIHQRRRNAITPGQTDLYHVLKFMSNNCLKVVFLSVLIVVQVVRFLVPVIDNKTPSIAIYLGLLLKLTKVMYALRMRTVVQANHVMGSGKGDIVRQTEENDKKRIKEKATR